MYISRTIHIKRLTAEQKERLLFLMKASGELYSAALNMIAVSSGAIDLRKTVGILRGTRAAENMSSYVFGIVKATAADVLKYKNTVRKSQRYGYSAYLEGEYFTTVQPPKPKSTYPLYCERVKQKDGKISVPSTDIEVLLYKGIETAVVNRLVLYERCSEFYMTVVFNTDEPKKPCLDRRKALGIDIGVNNIVTAVDTNGQSFILDGRCLKFLIYRYTVRKKQIDTEKKSNKLTHTTKREVRNSRERREQMNAYLNRCVHYIVEHCIKHRIGNVVVGHSRNFSDYELGRNNLIFGYMPYTAFNKKLEYECKKYGISFYRQDESYTSQASFYDGDHMPEHTTKAKQSFSGKRIHRGLYKSKEGLTINADVNGAANILKKFYDYTFNSNFVPPASFRELRDTGVAQPMRLKP